MTDSLPALVHTLQLQAQSSWQRRLLVLSGEAQWVRAQFDTIRNLLPDDSLFIGPADLHPQALALHDVRQWLGRQTPGAIYDAFAGFDPEALAIAEGTVGGGGIVVLLVPALEQWLQWDDPVYQRIRVWGDDEKRGASPYLERLGQILAEPHKGMALVRQHYPLPQLNPVRCLPPRPQRLDGFASDDQARAVEAILHVLEGHRKRPLVITADRGRGKSSALGLAIVRMLQQAGRHVLVSGPSRAALASVFERIAEHLPQSEWQGQILHWHNSAVEFVAPDDLAMRLPKADIVLVDEAAAIPQSLLYPLLSHYSRLVFSSTVHGYEGTGRGFAIHFQARLDDQTPGWQQCRLHTPVRWGLGDPVEQIVRRCLLLDSELATLPALPIGGHQVLLLSGQDFLEHESWLNQLFALLVVAHYRTSPMDLRQILESPSMSVALVVENDQVIAGALISREGGFDEELAGNIAAALRRPAGHLLVQALAGQSGDAACARQRAARIVRIAVHPERQRQGVGRLLLEKIAGFYEDMDYIGASFALSVDVLAFWQGCGFAVVGLGSQRSHVSGEVSVQVVRAMSDRGRELQGRLQQRFRAYFVDQLAEVFADLSPEQVLALLPRDGVASSAADQDLEQFANGRRGLDYVAPRLRQEVPAMLASSLFCDQEKALLVSKLLQRRSLVESARVAGYQGKKEAEAVLRNSYATWLKHVKELSG